MTTQSDYELMTWMKTNLPSDAIILVHPYGSGLFIPSVAHLKVIFPYTGSSLSTSYQTLVNLLENNTFNSQAYQIMHSWNISYVFVGTHVAYNYPIWDAKLFLGNPNFKLVKNLGSSFLFELDEHDDNMAFSDNFNSEPWHQNGWRNDTLGNGLTDVAIKESPSMYSSGSLSIMAQAVPALSSAMAQVGKGYISWVEREIFVPNSQNVTLSFYLNATDGFGQTDTFAVLIYNLHRNETIAVTTPNGFQLNHSESDILNSRQGTFSLNLSELWQRELNSSFPTAFVLQFANYDFDGVPSVAYVDNVIISCNDNP